MSSPAPGFYAFPSDNPAVPFSSGQVSVGTTATLIGTFEGNQSGVLISSSAACFIGGSGVTTTTGFPVPITTPVLVPTNGGVNSQLYAVVASSTATVSFIHPANGGSTNL